MLQITLRHQQGDDIRVWEGGAGAVLCDGVEEGRVAEELVEGALAELGDGALAGEAYDLDGVDGGAAGARELWVGVWPEGAEVVDGKGAGCFAVEGLGGAEDGNERVLRGRWGGREAGGREGRG